MVAPGIRHNAECKKRFAEFEEERRKERRVVVEDEQPVTVDVRHQMPTPNPEPIEVEMEENPGSVPPSVEVEGTLPSGSAQQQPGTQVEYVRRLQRKAETDREELEKEIREDANAMLKDNEEFDWFWVGSGEPVFLASLGALEGPASFTPATAPEMCFGFT